MTDDAATADRRATLVVSMTVDSDRAEEVDRHFRDDVRAWAQHQPGFLSAQWLRLPGGDRAMGLVTFESEAHAQAASQGPRAQPKVNGRAWNTDAVEVYAVITQA
jgi:quinol monooxygenase YgiN